jgi:hypothetical protein
VTIAFVSTVPLARSPVAVRPATAESTNSKRIASIGSSTATPTDATSPVMVSPRFTSRARTATATLASPRAANQYAPNTPRATNTTATPNWPTRARRSGA